MPLCRSCGKETPRKRCRSCAGKEAAYRRNNNLGKKKGICIDCGTTILPVSKRCNPCSMRHKWSNPEERDKMVEGLIRSHPKTANRNCIDCGARVCPGSQRCNSCARKIIWEREGFKTTVSKAVSYGLTHNEDAKKARANNPWFQRGESHPRWEGGRKGVSGAEKNQWRTDVLNRDSHTCQMCGTKEKLHAHHIKHFAQYPEGRTEVNNGITVCYDCHCTLHDHHIPPHQAYDNLPSRAVDVQLKMPFVIPDKGEG